ncbi:hypothetical protein Tco_0588128 [Tanacetum coccineum]
MISREKAAKQEAKNVTLVEQMEDVQARMDADELLAERLQQEEREQFTVDKQARVSMAEHEDLNTSTLFFLHTLYRCDTGEVVGVDKGGVATVGSVVWKIVLLGAARGMCCVLWCMQQREGFGLVW